MSGTKQRYKASEAGSLSDGTRGSHGRIEQTIVILSLQSSEWGLVVMLVVALVYFSGAGLELKGRFDPGLSELQSKLR